MMDSSECAGELLNISEATAAEASALSAVVQRDTAKLREALEFYAYPMNWVKRCLGGIGIVSAIDQDDGKKAREALQ